MSEKFQALIIDDEEPARFRLKSLLEKFEEVQIIGEAKNGLEAVALIDSLKPDLIFLDIKMPGLNGFEVLKKIKHSPYVIFCTAYDEFALKAFETKSVDYLLKPIEEDKLERSIRKLNEIAPLNSNEELLQMVQDMLSMKQQGVVSSLPIKKSDSVIFLKICEITYFKASEKYVEAFTYRGKKHLTEHSLRYLEDKLPSNFLRIQRSLIVNKDKIREVRKHFSGKYVFILDDVDQTSITSGRNYNQLIKGMFSL